MKAFEFIGVLITFAIIVIIGIPKLENTANKKKYKSVYYSIIAAGVLLSILELLGLVPDYILAVINLYNKIFNVS
jgi:hypothetical protein